MTILRSQQPLKIRDALEELSTLKRPCLALCCECLVQSIDRISLLVDDSLVVR